MPTASSPALSFPAATTLSWGVIPVSPRDTRPAQSKQRAPLFAARTLNATVQSRVTPSRAAMEVKSGLWATAGGKGGLSPPQKRFSQDDIAMVLIAAHEQFMMGNETAYDATYKGGP